MNLIEVGEKVFVVYRRLFFESRVRHFIGEIDVVSNHVCRATGTFFILDKSDNTFIGKNKKRTIFINLSESGSIVTVLPKDTIIGSIMYSLEVGSEPIISDGDSLELNISEYLYE